MSSPKSILIDEFNYPLPTDRIAKFPLSKRDTSKLLIYKNEHLSQDSFLNLDQFLPINSLLIFNETKVIQARLQFFKESGAKIEIFCLEPVQPVSEVQLAFQQKSAVVWKCFIGNSKKWKEGSIKKLLSINDEQVGKGKVEKQIRGRFGVESLDVGVDACSPVSKSYSDKRPFWFTGTIEKVCFDFGDGTDLSPQEKLEQHVKMD